MDTADTGAADKKEDNGIYIVIENNHKQPKDNYKAKTVKVLSSMHILVGSVAMAVGIFKLILGSSYQRNEEPFETYLEGLICGGIFVFVGLTGLFSLRKTTYCRISAFLVLSIFSSLFGFIMAVVTYAGMHRAYYKNYLPALYSHYTLICCGLLELLLGVVSASFACSACCGCCGGPGAGAAAGAGDKRGASSVVYIPTAEAGEGGESTGARVVHLNMADIRSKQVQVQEPGDTAAPGDTEAEAANKDGKYSRFF